MVVHCLFEWLILHFNGSAFSTLLTVTLMTYILRKNNLTKLRQCHIGLREVKL